MDMKIVMNIRPQFLPSIVRPLTTQQDNIFADINIFLRICPYGEEYEEAKKTWNRRVDNG